MASLMTALTIISAYIILPIGPVPVTMQTCVVLIAGGVLGGRWGGMSQILYLVMGLIGLPVFSGGRGGPGIILSPTFGYLVGFIVAAYISGRFIEGNSRRSIRHIIPGMILAHMAIWICGLSYLSVYYRIILSQPADWQTILATGLIPFLPFDAVKIALAVSVTLALNRYLSAPEPDSSS